MTRTSVYIFLVMILSYLYISYVLVSLGRGSYAFFARRTKTIANEQLGEVWPSCYAIVTIVTDLAEVLIDADKLTETVCKCYNGIVC